MKDRIKEIYLGIRRCMISKPIRALRLAVLKAKIEESLKNGFSYFTYQKPNGELRETIATQDKELTANYKFKGTKRLADNEVMLVTAWDAQKCMWRTFRIDRIKKLHI